MSFPIHLVIKWNTFSDNWFTSFSPQEFNPTAPSYSKTNQMHQCIKFIYFRKTLYMFWTVFPSVISSSRLYILLSYRHCCLLASGYLLASRYPLASRQQYLFDKCLLLYVQSCTADDGWKDCPKNVERLSKINKFDTLVHLVGFTVEIILWCMALWTSVL